MAQQFTNDTPHLVIAQNAQEIPLVPALGGMRVMVDARKLRDGGIGRYTENLLRGLTSCEGVEVGAIIQPGTLDSPLFKTSNWVNKVELIEDRGSLYSVDEMLRLSKRVPWQRFDMFHAPHYTLPMGMTIPTTVTIHDLIHITHPQHFYYPFIARRLIGSALKRANRVIAVSQSTYLNLCSSWPHPRIVDKIRVVPNALDPSYEKRSDPADFLTARFRLQGNYLLAVASNLKPHKGVVDLLRAFRSIKQGTTKDALPAKVRNDLKLVLVGKGTEGLVDIEKLLDKAGSIPEVYLFGAVSNEELRNLYAGAAALVVPSLAEGFFLPVLEAKSQGTPVIARPVPAIAELLDESDLVCGDFSEEKLTNGIVRYLNRAQLSDERATAIDRFQTRLPLYDYREVAHAVLSVYREALN